MRFHPSSRTIALVQPATSRKGVWPSDVPGQYFPGAVSSFRGRLSQFTPGAGVSTLMAFGFGFNKQKALSAAEKYVQQGKLQNAIAEYAKVIKADAKDLTVTNTIGDLYSRLGQADKATDCFKTVGDAYATQGFTDRKSTR